MNLNSITKILILKYILLIFSVLAISATISSKVQAQTSSVTYAPNLEIYGNGGEDFSFTDGKGVFNCSNFNIVTTSGQGNPEHLRINIDCVDKTRFYRKISIEYNGKYNDKSATNTSLPIPPILACWGRCGTRLRRGSRASSLRSLWLGNLTGTVEIGVTPSEGTRPSEDRIKKTRYCRPTQGNDCKSIPLEMKIHYNTNLKKYSVFFRLGRWTPFNPAAFANTGDNKDDPSGPKSAQYAGGQAATSSELAVADSNNN